MRRVVLYSPTFSQAEFLEVTMQRIKLTIAMLIVLCATVTSLWPRTAVKGQSGELTAPTGDSMPCFVPKAEHTAAK
jgi:hypothetical protein